MYGIPIAILFFALAFGLDAPWWIRVPAVVLLIIEATTQTYWFGLVKVWRLTRIPVFGASGFTAHPWAVFSTARSEAHEIAGHVEPMAKYGWLPKVVFYVADATFRTWCEIRGDVAKIPDALLGASDNDPKLESKVLAIAQDNISTDGLYHGKWYLFGDPPSLEQAIEITWREIINRRRRRGA